MLILIFIQKKNPPMPSYLQISIVAKKMIQKVICIFEKLYWINDITKQLAPNVTTNVNDSQAYVINCLDYY